MLILLCVFLACRATPMEPGVSLRPPLTPSVAAEQGCARLDVRVKGRETITVEDDTVLVSAGGACGGLRPVISGIPEFDRTTNRVRLPVALQNNGASPVQAPARLYGWEDSLTVIEAPGLAQNEWTASYLDFVASDSALADTSANFPGALLWRYDTLLTQGGLAVGATSGARWIELAVHSGVQRFEVVLHAEAAGVIRNPVPIEPPDSIPAWVFADSNVVDSSAYISGAFIKNILIVAFRDGATQAERQAAIDTVGGTVVGGVRFGFIEGDYVVRVNDPGDGSQLLAAANLLMTLPQIRYATIEVKVHFHNLGPHDGEELEQWQPTPDAGSGPGVIRNPVPIEPPDSIPAWVHADSNIAAASSHFAGPFAKNVLLVAFKPGASQIERQAAIDLVGGVVIGGVRFSVTEGYYLIRVADPGDASQLLSAAEKLNQLPQVSNAGLETTIDFNYASPEACEFESGGMISPYSMA